MKRVLVVDDDPDLREVVAALLGQLGFDVHASIHGQDALDELRRWRPDAMLIDMSMPVMDGFTLRRRMMEDPNLACIPAILFTASSKEPTGDEAQTFQGMVRKPFELRELTEALAAVLAH